MVNENVDSTIPPDPAHVGSGSLPTVPAISNDLWLYNPGTVIPHQPNGDQQTSSLSRSDSSLHAGFDITRRLDGIELRASEVQDLFKMYGLLPISARYKPF